jgi:hypothetical protein
MASYLLKEDGGKIMLEDESGFLLLEEEGEAARSRTGLYSHLSHMRRRMKKCVWILINLIGV